MVTAACASAGKTNRLYYPSNYGVAGANVATCPDACDAATPKRTDGATDFSIVKSRNMDGTTGFSLVKFPVRETDAEPQQQGPRQQGVRTSTKFAALKETDAQQQQQEPQQQGDERSTKFAALKETDAQQQQQQQQQQEPQQQGHARSTKFPVLFETDSPQQQEPQHQAGERSRKKLPVEETDVLKQQQEPQQQGSLRTTADNTQSSSTPTHRSRFNPEEEKILEKAAEDQGTTRDDSTSSGASTARPNTAEKESSSHAVDHPYG